MVVVEPPQHEAGQQRAGDRSSGENLSFLDLFYAVPIADLAVRISGARLDAITTADWTTIAVEVTVLMLSWVGLHQNRANIERQQVAHWAITDVEFFSWRFLQFCIEILITAMYYVVGLTIDLGTTSVKGPPPVPSATWVLGCLVIIWVLYLIWDLFDISIATKHQKAKWAADATAGAKITVLMLLVLVILAFIQHASAPDGHQRAVTWWNVSLIALLYLYRVAQQVMKGRQHPGPGS